MEKYKEKRTFIGELTDEGDEGLSSIGSRSSQKSAVEESKNVHNPAISAIVERSAFEEEEDEEINSTAVIPGA